MTEEKKLPENILNGWKILVVDDEPDSLEVAEHILMFYGADVYTAKDGEAGYKKAKEVRPHFIISDISMPGVSGWEMIERLKKDVATTEIPVVALTAHAMSGDRQRAIAAGFHNYLTKPLTVKTFIRDLLRLLVDIPQLADDLSSFDLEL